MPDPRPRILVIDDEPLMLEALKRALRREFDIEVCTSPQAGLSLLRERAFAAVMCDLQMPGMDGFDFLDAARKIAPGTPQLLFTGTLDEALHIETPFRLVAKPCPNDRLAQILRDVTA